MQLLQRASSALLVNAAINRSRPIRLHVLASVLAAAFLVIAPIEPATAHASKFVYLVQNSGWMEPFFSDSRTTKFDAAVDAFIERTAPAQASITIASFNKAGEIEGQSSPSVVYQGAPTHEAIVSALSRINLRRRSDGRLPNSDYREALLGAVTDVLQSRPGVIFMITNNKSAPNGREQPEDGPVTERTEAFNNLLKSSDAISRIVAWPLRFPVHGMRFNERGLVIYGIAYGDAASNELSQASESPAVRQLLNDPPVRLKPLSFDPLVLSLTAGRRGDLNWYADAAGRVVIDGVSSSGDVVSMIGSLTNTHYPYVIRHARVIAFWTPAVGSTTQASVAIVPTNIKDLASFSSVNGVAIDLALSRAQRPSWLADRAMVPGTLSIQLVDMELGLSPAFVQKMTELFGSGAAPRPDDPTDLPAQVPKIFINYKAVNQATTQIPLTLVVSFFPWPLIGLISILALALVVLIAGGWFLTRETPFPVSIDGESRMIGLRPLQSKEVRGMRGTYIVSRGLFGTPNTKLKSA